MSCASLWDWIEHDMQKGWKNYKYYFKIPNIMHIKMPNACSSSTQAPTVAILKGGYWPAGKHSNRTVVKLFK